MSKSYDITTRAVVLARRTLGEGSVRAALYTEDFGLVYAAARSAREERSKLRPHLLVGSFGTYTIVRGKQEWKLVGAVETKNAYFELAAHTELQRASSRVVGIVRSLVQGEECNTDLFAALWSYLSTLSSESEMSIEYTERRVVARILCALGYVAADTALLSDERELTRRINEAFAASSLVTTRAL